MMVGLIHVEHTLMTGEVALVFRHRVFQYCQSYIPDSVIQEHLSGHSLYNLNL